jgi:cell division cycle protein 37
MPVNYSKWDALELSDDSDIEVHPNVDKKSFIRAKQNQIHQARIDRKHRIETLKYESVVNHGLLSRIDALLKALESHRAAIEGKNDASSIDEVVFDSLMDVTSNSSLGADQPPGAPPGVHSKEQQPSYSQMMAALVDQVKSEVDKVKAEGGAARYAAYVKEVQNHDNKVKDLQKELEKELETLEKEGKGKITSESIREGFNSSFVAKPAPKPTPAASESKKSAEPELLNPSRPQTSVEQIGGPSASTSAADELDDEEDFKASPLGKQFGKIKFGDYRTSLQFIGAHPEIVSERETDGLLAEAFDAQKGKLQEEYARQCVHQALLLQYCRQLGKDGVGLFFQRVQTRGHKAQQLFLDDVNSTYARIRERCAELDKLAAESGGEREQIQLHAVDPDTKINIVTPRPLEQCESDEERASRQIFESFTPELQKAISTGEIDKINVVLGKMSVEDAEKVVEQLGDGGMISLSSDGIIDATTEEGQEAIKEIERTRQLPGDAPRETSAAATEGDDLGLD